ncbi:hypothetical protein QYM36_001785 [Artemia franciscana]|uniref:Uncharacterized protein n=1 Tax=Artemia franciscana TaxID=6661 RepID=A0AA88LE70_ARTSF|nr:hypothetical protein QYM36_001785 [Artemia franciscana]
MDPLHIMGSDGQRVDKKKSLLNPLSLNACLTLELDYAMLDKAIKKSVLADRCRSHENKAEKAVEATRKGDYRSELDSVPQPDAIKHCSRVVIITGYVIREDPVAIFDSFPTISGLFEDEKTNTGQSFEERLDGKSFSRLLFREVTKSSLDMTKCIGQGYDKAASSSAKQTKLLKKHLISDNRGAETLICLCTARFVKRHEATSRGVGETVTG